LGLIPGLLVRRRTGSSLASLGVFAAVGLALLGVAGVQATHATPALALGAGRVCLFNAPTGARIIALNAGHVGWAYRVGGQDQWVFGATEDPTASPVVLAGANNGTWSQTGNWTTVVSTFQNGGPYHRNSNYYTQYRCTDWPSSAVGAANAMVSTVTHNGYLVTNNNCLTKALDIFRAYGVNNLPSGDSVFPNFYFDHLPSSWGATIPLTPQENQPHSGVA
jgi:hypothetical protein